MHFLLFESRNPNKILDYLIEIRIRESVMYLKHKQKIKQTNKQTDLFRLISSHSNKTRFWEFESHRWEIINVERTAVVGGGCRGG